MVGLCFGCGIKSADAEADFHGCIRHSTANAVMADHGLQVFNSNAGSNRNDQCIFNPFFGSVDCVRELLWFNGQNNSVNLCEPGARFFVRMNAVSRCKVLQSLFIVINDVNIGALPITGNHLRNDGFAHIAASDKGDCFSVHAFYSFLV